MSFGFLVIGTSEQLSKLRTPQLAIAAYSAQEARIESRQATSLTLQVMANALFLFILGEPTHLVVAAMIGQLLAATAMKQVLLWLAKKWLKMRLERESNE